MIKKNIFNILKDMLVSVAPVWAPLIHISNLYFNLDHFILSSRNVCQENEMANVDNKIWEHNMIEQMCSVRSPTR